MARSELSWLLSNFWGAGQHSECLFVEGKQMELALIGGEGY